MLRERVHTYCKYVRTLDTIPSHPSPARSQSQSQSQRGTASSTEQSQHSLVPPASPRTASPRTASPRTASPRTAVPRLASHCLAMSCVAASPPTKLGRLSKPSNIWQPNGARWRLFVLAIMCGDFLWPSSSPPAWNIKLAQNTIDARRELQVNAQLQLCDLVAMSAKVASIYTPVTPSELAPPPAYLKPECHKEVKLGSYCLLSQRLDC